MVVRLGFHSLEKPGWSLAVMQGRSAVPTFILNKRPLDRINKIYKIIIFLLITPKLYKIKTAIALNMLFHSYLTFHCIVKLYDLVKQMPRLRIVLFKAEPNKLSVFFGRG
ncbi:MAG: hypothetical protein SCARUB_01262 [Candidatus Scalindua rubra]|uniref:Uncharacterized protein n=1 Tax=Candidatus Scalindua rubra TaxID=1872076 RepID=A0A1E3XDC3_9BACT|nr:MAG: hypothetical protein SCARUB_01262 [Candidatus Scalindua rubra]